ncbi:hypothetical protein PINS_up022523 [Pythium insidiosum]|nr:hypothetical protein PINS_up022523 [Pythium insidiosum]
MMNEEAVPQGARSPDLTASTATPEVPVITGSISLPATEECTLDEPVSATILRDVRLVAGKLKVVLVPKNTSEETLKALRDWDLWGPLMLCLSLSIMLSMTAPAHQSAMVFTGVFVVVWAGACSRHASTPNFLAAQSLPDQLNKLIRDIETDLGIDANAPLPSTRRPPPAGAQKKPGRRQAQEGEGRQAAGAAKKAAADADQPEITKLDIRVGKIVKVWKHDTADKLYCEEIDVGEDAPRQIASGLVYHYSLEEMQDRRILVAARNLVGFKSHGMVMCAAVPTEDGKEKVAFVEPPADAAIGERIVFEGLTGEPFTPAQVEKKKVLVNIGEDMKTDANGIATWKGHVFQTSAGPCTAPVANGVIR